MISIQHNPRSLAATAAVAGLALLLFMPERASAQGVDASASVGGVDASASVGGGGASASADAGGVSADASVGGGGGGGLSGSASVGGGGFDADASASIGGGGGISGTAGVGAGGTTGTASVGIGGDPLGALGDAISGLFGGPAAPSSASFGTGTAAPATGVPTGVQLTRMQRRCIDVLLNPEVYDQALVELCQQVRARQLRQAQRGRRRAGK